jgi:hypothetical protein
MFNMQEKHMDVANRVSDKILGTAAKGRNGGGGGSASAK